MLRQGAFALLMACAAAATGLVACAQAGASSSPGSAELLRSIRAEIGQAHCETDAQCHVIGVGAKPCGGPEGYLAWSSQSSDRQRLLSLVEQHRAVRRIELERSGLLSDCRIALEPRVACLPAVEARDASGAKACRLLAPPGNASSPGPT